MTAVFLLRVYTYKRACIGRRHVCVCILCICMSAYIYIESYALGESSTLYIW